MAYTVYANSQSVTGTEHSMPNDATYAAGSVKTDDGIMQGWVDLAALLAGDEFAIKIYETVQAGTPRVVGVFTFVGAQGDPIFVFPALAVADGWDATIIKVAGTDRTIYWSIRVVPV